MSPTQRVETIERVFHAARALAPEQRRAFVQQALKDQPELVTEVEELLAAADQSTTFLESSLLEGPAHPAPASDAMIGRMIGPYRIIRELGRGGMGVVYEAEQRMPQRRVALKVVHGGAWADPANRRLLGHEPRILGRLNHPSVASIFDAAQTEDGVSYFVMELIEGERLDRFVEQHDLDRRERLRLFCKVCEAIQHAHMKSVIHLDLKPSNILVVGSEAGDGTDDLKVKVVDFGVAAITGSDTALPTRAGGTDGIPGTLAYMSPEQRRGERDLVDARSDVYSLGVVLFKLVTGDLPHPVEGLSLPDAYRMLEQEPARRARAVDPTVPYDVDTIIQTAMAEEPARRYQSVAELAGDVRRFLADLPIAAHRPSRLYEWSKFAKRNKGLVGSLTVVLLWLITTIVGTSIGLMRFREAWAVAQREADNNALLFEMVLAAASVRADEATIPRHEPGIEEGSSPALRKPLEVRRRAAQANLSEGRAREAREEYDRLVRTSRLIFPKDDWFVAVLQGEYGECLAQLGDFARAEQELLGSYDRLRLSRDDDHYLTVQAIRRLIDLYLRWGRPGEAALWEAKLPPAAAQEPARTPPPTGPLPTSER